MTHRLLPGAIGLAALTTAVASWRYGDGDPRFIATGGSFIAVGLYAWVRRPDSRTGKLLALTGWATWTALAEATRVPLLWTVGSALEASWLPALAVLLLTFPSGRLTGTAARFVVWASVGFVVVGGVLGSTAYDPRDFGCADCPAHLNLLLVRPSYDYVATGGPLVLALLVLAGLAITVLVRVRSRERRTRRATAATVAATLVAIGLGFVVDSAATADALRLAPVGMVLLLALAGLVVARWWRASGPARRVLGPMLLPAAAFCLAVASQQAIGALLSVTTVYQPPPLLFRMLTDVATAASVLLPLTFLLGLARARRRQARVGDLVVELAELPPLDELERLLSKTLRDPSLAVGRWDAVLRRYDRGNGSALELPGANSGRTATLLERDGAPLAVIVHDDALREDDALLASVAAGARLVVENADLQAAVTAQLADVRASRARLVAAGDGERRRLERDLHDGAQQRLVSACLDLKLLAASLDPAANQELHGRLREATEELQRGLAELRELARGIHPAVLTDEGLQAATQSLADRARLPTELVYRARPRYDAALEATAYFIVSEALANIAKHANATRALVSVLETKHAVVVEVADDGTGGADPAKGSGLRGLMDRVAAVDGRLELKSSVGDGTRVVAELPCG